MVRSTFSESTTGSSGSCRDDPGPRRSSSPDHSKGAVPRPGASPTATTTTCSRRARSVVLCHSTDHPTGLEADDPSVHDCIPSARPSSHDTGRSAQRTPTADSMTLDFPRFRTTRDRAATSNPIDARASRWGSRRTPRSTRSRIAGATQPIKGWSNSINPQSIGPVSLSSSRSS